VSAPSAASAVSTSINGVEFEIEDTTEVVIGDTIITGDADYKQSYMALGQVVKVEGEFHDDGVTGTASSVKIDGLVEGPITAPVDTTNRIIEVVYQTVLYDSSTVFEDSNGGSLTPDQLDVGNVVEVYGFPDSSLQIKATRVEKESDSFIPGTDVIEIKGMVANLDTTLMVFDIGALEVQYSMATTIDNGSLDDLANDRFVEVKGTNDVVVDRFLTADKIEFEDPFSGNDGDLLEVEGNISSVTTSTDFVVNGMIRVDASGARFEGGTKADVAVDVEVEVEGYIEDRNGELLVLVAREVEFEHEDDDVLIEAFVEAVDTSAETLTLLGITVNYSSDPSETEFEDMSGGSDPFSAGDIDAAAPSTDWLLIEARVDSSYNLMAATRIERNNDDADDTRVILKGPAENIAVTSFDLLGVGIDTDGSTVYYMGEDTEIGQTIFFNNLGDGRPVKARGSYTPGTLTAERLELND